jgi:hypothetical protein
MPVPSNSSELGSGVGVTGGVGLTGGVSGGAGGAPEGPDDPDGPEAPDGPDDPAGPDDPDGPDVPVDPVGPDDPDGPDGPDVPVGPTGPDVPVEPVDPDGPFALTTGAPGISITGGTLNTPLADEPPLPGTKSERAGSAIMIGKVIASNGDGFIGVSSSSGFGSTRGLRAFAGSTWATRLPQRVRAWFFPSVTSNSPLCSK